MMNHDHDLVVFSHLRWQFVYQRPQHVLSRMARRRRVLFIEEPVSDPGGPKWEFSPGADNVLVCQPRLPTPSGGFLEGDLPALADLMRELVAEQRLTRYGAWFYTPMALPLLDALAPDFVVYDCMDELSLFRGAPTSLVERERQLLKKADLVFTGGRSIYRAKQQAHANIHCFPSSVDAEHFGKARDSADEAREQSVLPRPRLGFFGVIDERFDIPLIDAVAAAKPEWQFILLGPVVKIDPADLPRRDNLHYLGPKPYAELPSYLSGWDVCLLPFARNDATRFISPTKTLEYMAAERPIVSTPITDVAEPYGEIVYLADDAPQFVAACERALSASTDERDRRAAKMREVIASTSWESVVAAMESLIAQVAQPRTIEAASKPRSAKTNNARVKPSARIRRRSPASPPVAIVGAGPTGLSAAFHLGAEALLLEQQGQVGGWCRSIYRDGFVFDYAGHIMFSNDPYVHEMYAMLLGDNVHWQDREAWVYSKGVYTRYPFQGALYGLPPEVIKDCLVGAIEARFGPLKTTSPQANGNGAAGNGAADNGAAGNGAAGNGACLPTRPRKAGTVRDCCGDGLLESTAVLSSNGHAHGAGPANFEEFIHQVWGKGIAAHFAIPYNKKLWAVPLSEMETSWLGGRVPMPDLEEMIEGALKPVPKPMGPNARFGYPLRGGFQALMDGFLPRLTGELRLGTRVSRIAPAEHYLVTDDGARVDYDCLISTMPLPALIGAMGPHVPGDVRAAAAGLRHVSVRCVHLGVARERLTEKHWIYYPEDPVFHRIFVQGNASPHCNPPGGFGLTCEITYSPHKPLPCEGDALIERCVADCKAVGIMAADDQIMTAVQCDLPFAYVVYDHARQENVSLIRQWLEEHDILLAGRYSEWEYYNSDHAFLAGKKAAEKAMSRRPARAAAPESSVRQTASDPLPTT